MIEVDRIEAFYEDYVADTGTTVGWTDVQYAEMAYQLATGWPGQDWARTQAVLDVGSGEGGLLSFLRARRGYRGGYVGVEVLDRFHRGAVARVGDDPGAVLHHAEFLAWDAGDARFDLVFSLGSLSVRQADPEAHDDATLRKMVGLARVGVVVYVNDARRMPDGWERDNPGLMAHDVAAFAARARALPGVRGVAKRRFPSWEGPGVMVWVGVG